MALLFDWLRCNAHPETKTVQKVRYRAEQRIGEYYSPTSAYVSDTLHVQVSGSRDPYKCKLTFYHVNKHRFRLFRDLIALQRLKSRYINVLLCTIPYLDSSST